MIDRIREMERLARLLEPDAAERRRLREPVVAYAESFLERLGKEPAYRADKSAAAGLRARPITDVPLPVEDVLRLLRECVDTPGLNPASGGHLAYIPGGGLYASALGDYLADVTNRYAGIRFTGPGAVEMENLLLDWMAELVGYPPDSAGNLASGGSVANLIAIVTAREAHDLRARDFERAVVYLSPHAHHCLDKALRVAGMAECVRRPIALDERYRMIPEALDAAVAEDRAAGLIPWMAIASAGTTDVGAIDPLEAVGGVAARHGLWYHIDAAYGGFFALCPEIRPALAGMELSDSLVLDPHKGLFLPYGTGAVLVKDRAAMARAHRYRAAYMQDAVEGDAGGDSPAELSPELSKHFRGLRLWLPLLVHGVEPFRAGLREKLLLTRWFQREAAARGFEVGPEPELSVAVYRWVPEVGDADAFNRALLEEVHRDGRVFISSTTLEAKFVLRLAALAFRTHLAEIELLLDVLEEKVAALTGGGGPRPAVAGAGEEPR